MGQAFYLAPDMLPTEKISRWLAFLNTSTPVAMEVLPIVILA